MTKHKRILAALASALLLFGALGGSVGYAAALSAADYENVKEKDLDDGWSAGSSTLITLEGDIITVEGTGAEANGSSLTITQEGTYVLAGVLNNGQIIIDAPDDADVRVVLNGATLHCEDSAAIHCVMADKLILILAEGTENFVSDGSVYTFPDAETDEPNAAIFSQQDLTINGSGSLTVTASYNNGIGTKDDLVLVRSNISVTAPNHAIRGRDSVTVIDASLTLEAGNDGIQSNNADEGKGWITLYGGNYVITAAHDGIQAENALTIYDGDFDIRAGGGSVNAPERVEEGPGGNRGMRAWGGGTTPEEDVSAEDTASVMEEDTVSDSFKALKAGGDLVVAGGVFTIDSADDALHTNANLTISGGIFTIATGDDAAHADGDLLIDGNPVLSVAACYEGMEGTNVTVNGGEITIHASDDGINAAGGSSNGEGMSGAFGADRFTGGGEYRIAINGGVLHITAAYDGLDSNGDILITGGAVYVSGAGVEAPGGDGAVDCDGAFAITGGAVAAAGGTAFAIVGGGASSVNSGGTQPVLNFRFTDVQAEGAIIELKDAAGTVLVEFTADKAFKTIALSSEAMQEGESYTVYVNGDVVYTVALSGVMTSVSDTGETVDVADGGPGGMGGGRGGMPGSTEETK